MLAPIFVSLCISGFCMGSRDVNVTVNALAAPDAHSQTKFIVVPAVQGVSSSDLQFQEYAGEIGRALVAQGFEQAASVKDVTMVVMVNYAISAPRDRIITTTGTTMAQHTVVDGISRPAAPGLPGMVSSHTEFAPVPTQNAQTVTTYVRTLQMKVFDQAAYNATQQAKELWEANIVSEGDGADLREILPIMVAAAQPYLGVNTTKPAAVTIGMNDAKIKYIRGEAPLPAKK